MHVRGDWYGVEACKRGSGVETKWSLEWARACEVRDCFR